MSYTFGGKKDGRDNLKNIVAAPEEFKHRVIKHPASYQPVYIQGK